jgi:Flp pilus assembly protein TadB
VKFWCPDVDTEFQFRMTRADLIKFAANFSKHRLLRLNTLLEQLRALTRRAGREVQGTQLVAVREPFVVEVQSRLLYLASWLVELLGGVFSALNTVVVTRSNVERTNDVRKMRMPEGVTSDAICNLYGDTLVFKRYDEERIARFVPRVPDLLKLRY